MAALTKFFGWGANDWRGMTLAELIRWSDEAARMVADAGRRGSGRG